MVAPVEIGEGGVELLVRHYFASLHLNFAHRISPHRLE